MAVAHACRQAPEDQQQKSQPAEAEPGEDGLEVVLVLGPELLQPYGVFRRDPTATTRARTRVVRTARRPMSAQSEKAHVKPLWWWEIVATDVILCD